MANPDVLDVLAEMRRQVEDARASFLAEVDTQLAEARITAHSLAHAIGEVSSAQALTAWREFVITQFNRWNPTP